jgi:hypothetical protein
LVVVIPSGACPPIVDRTISAAQGQKLTLPRHGWPPCSTQLEKTLALIRSFTDA